MSITKTRLTHGLALRFGGMQGVISVLSRRNTAHQAEDIVSAFVELDALSCEWYGEVVEIVLAASALCSEPQRKELISYLARASESPTHSKKHHVRHAMYTIISRRYD